jgi:hypothetical protein
VTPITAFCNFFVKLAGVQNIAAVLPGVQQGPDTGGSGKNSVTE